MLIGRTKGPGEHPHEFTFIARDTNQALKIGEFVVHYEVVNGVDQAIYSRITTRTPVRLYPDHFMADADVHPVDVAVALGYDTPSPELYQLTAVVIGYYDTSLDEFINPRIPPRSGAEVYLAEHDDLTRVLSTRNQGAAGGATIGSLLSRPIDTVPVTVDLRDITSTHLAIIASTGAGKSYTASVLVEELMMPKNRAAVLIVDPHGEYDTLTEMANVNIFRSNDGYIPDVHILTPSDINIRIGTLTLGDLYYLLPNLSERMGLVLRWAYRDAREISTREHHNPDRWTLMQLIQHLEHIGLNEDGGPSEYQTSTDAVIWRLRSILENSTIFDDIKHLKLNKLVVPGRCTVLQLNEVGEREQQVVVATLSRRLFHARMTTVKRLVSQDDDQYLPYPVFIILEEAHRYAPAAGDAISTDILKQVLGEGRKFGIGICLISQRPGKLDADILSQCNTQFIMRIVNPVDQARVAESVESIGRDLIRELPSLTKGQAIIAGQAVNTPLMCRVRSRHTPHGAESLDAPQQWLDYFSPANQEKRVRDQAPVQRDRQGRGNLRR